MDIEEFYDQDERRRESAEVELGSEWLDHHGQRYQLNWVQDTGELYVMHEPFGPEWEDPFGGIHVPTDDDVPVDGMQVTVLGTVADHQALEQVLDGWQAQVGTPDSVHWLAERLRTAGILTATAEETGPT